MVSHFRVVTLSSFAANGAVIQNTIKGWKFPKLHLCM